MLASQRVGTLKPFSDQMEENAVFFRLEKLLFP